MKKLTLLLASALLLSGLAIAQSHDERQNNPDQQNNANLQGRAMADNRDRAPAEKITNGPVIENVGNSWATVAWSTDTGGSSVVHYGTDRNRLTEMAETPYDASKGDHGVTHRVKIDHLQPGTRYYYMVDSGQGQGTGTEARSRVEEFTTKR
jgi:phosphodiesterase/alkaline phosphatase D-like protein